MVDSRCSSFSFRYQVSEITGERLNTVEPRYTGPKNNGNLPITNAKLWTLQVISFNFLYWQ